MPFGHVESNEGGFQKLGRLSRPSNYHLPAGSLRELHGFGREMMSQADRELMSLGEHRTSTGDVRSQTTIRACVTMPTARLEGT